MRYVCSGSLTGDPAGRRSPVTAPESSEASRSRFSSVSLQQPDREFGFKSDEDAISDVLPHRT
jgi:hypothetical protein